LRYVHGFTLIELVVTVMIVALLATSATPMLQLNQKRMKEATLRMNLRQIRDAIDAYKKAADEGGIETEATQSGYPPTLSVLEAGAIDQTDPDKKQRLRFIRHIPRDPMHTDPTQSPAESWGLRSYHSEATAPQSGEDVYDVYSLSDKTAIDGTPYSEW
jgi:general secretion pathway protein G